jgi:hypothetical protein
MPTTSTYLAMYRKGRVIVFVAAQRVRDYGKKRKGIVLGSLHTHEFLCYTKEVHHLGNAKQRSDHNHAAGSSSKEHCEALIFEKGTEIRLSLYY